MPNPTDGEGFYTTRVEHLERLLRFEGAVSHSIVQLQGLIADCETRARTCREYLAKNPSNPNNRRQRAYTKSALVEHNSERGAYMTALNVLVKQLRDHGILDPVNPANPDNPTEGVKP